MKIFALKLDSKLSNSYCRSLLSLIGETKSERLLKFVFQEDLQRGLFADLIVRKAIIERFNINNEDIYFSVNEFGKPYCEFLDDFHFNVSHSGDWVVCATDRNPVGIDIEKISMIDLDISKNFFSEKEHQDLMLNSNPFNYFFDLWSLKESYIKFIGKGLSHPLNSFTMKLHDHDKAYIESDNKILENVYFKQFSIDPGYKMAVCSSNPNMTEEVLIYSVNDIINAFITAKIATYY